MPTMISVSYSDHSHFYWNTKDILFGLIFNVSEHSGFFNRSKDLSMCTRSRVSLNPRAAVQFPTIILANFSKNIYFSVGVPCGHLSFSGFIYQSFSSLATGLCNQRADRQTFLTFIGWFNCPLILAWRWKSHFDCRLNYRSGGFQLVDIVRRFFSTAFENNSIKFSLPRSVMFGYVIPKTILGEFGYFIQSSTLGLNFVIQHAVCGRPKSRLFCYRPKNLASTLQSRQRKLTITDQHRYSTSSGWW